MIGEIDLEFRIEETAMDLPSAGLVLADELPGGRLRALGARTRWASPGATTRKERVMHPGDPPAEQGQYGRPVATAADRARSAGAPTAVVGDGNEPAEPQQRSVPLPVDADAHELFRRAIVKDDQAAW